MDAPSAAAATASPPPASASAGRDIVAAAAPPHRLRALRSRVLETSSDGTQIMLSFRVKALACIALFPPRAIPGAGEGEEDKGAHGAEAAVQ
jgi:hypothetical protein